MDAQRRMKDEDEGKQREKLIEKNRVFWAEEIAHPRVWKDV